MDNKLLGYFEGDELAANVWKGKYAQGGEETPDQMHRRMAREFARVEEVYQRQEDSLRRNTNEYINLSTYGIKRDSLTEESIYEFLKILSILYPKVL